MSDTNESTGFSRRTFMKASGVAAGAGVAGLSAVGSTAAATAVPREFSNPRVLRAAHAWERGYRGRADRSLAITDTGADARHPDVGPWNGVTVTTPGEFTLIDAELAAEADETVVDEFSAAGSIGPGTPETRTQQEHQLDEITDTDPLEADVLESSLSWTPAEQDLEFYLDALLETGDRKRLSTQQTANNPETLSSDLPTELTVERDDGTEETVAVADYVFIVETWANVTAEYEIEGSLLEVDGVDPELSPDEVQLPPKGEQPQLVAWHNDDTGQGDFDAPRDENSHGTHVTGIMTGTGQASTFDPERSIVEDPNAVLLPGDTISYEIEACANTGVFASAYGEGIDLVVEGPDGRELATSAGASGTPEIAGRNNTTETPTVHGSGREDDSVATYTAHVRGIEGEALPAQVESVAVGAFKHFSETAGDALAGEAGDRSLHAGVAPGYSQVTVTGLSGATASLAEFAEDFVTTFDIRAVNMSWGLIGGLPLGTVAGIGSSTIEDIRLLADAGILTVAAAGNDATPASGNAPPAVANEALSVVATGPLDGIAAYSSGGVGGVDDETSEPYTKPDVAAIGGAVSDLDFSAIPGEPDSDEEYGDVRLYSGKGGTSMASPSVCGLAGLVMQAMEEDGPEGLDIPSPTALVEDHEPDERRAWALTVKQAILATASTTAFHAAPYHGAKAPVYTHADRDPYEGFGRVNVGAAVDAVTRDLQADGELDGFEVLGTDLPADEQAAAGYLRAEGTVDVSVAFSHYGGANAGMTKSDPHVDLVVYDAENPAGVSDGTVDGTATGDPNVVASAQGVGGDASVSFEADGGLYYVTAELVSVPGVVNGYDVQAYLELDLDVEAPPAPAFEAAGDRSIDSPVVSGRQANRVELTVTDLDDDAEVLDRFPGEWRFLERFGDGEVVDDGVVSFGTVDADDVSGDDQVTFTYFVETPDDADASGTYGFGPARAEHVGDGDYSTESAEFAGQDDAILVGVDV